MCGPTPCRGQPVKGRQRRYFMSNTIWIKVVGFSQAERHTLNTLFRVSVPEDTHYSLWNPEGSGGTPCHLDRHGLPRGRSGTGIAHP